MVPLKILVAHNAYQQRGGEDEVVRTEVQLLRENGHDVTTWIASNDAIDTPVRKTLAALGAVFSLRSYMRARSLLKEIRPDVVHVHNFFPLLSPSIFFACAHEGVPVVLTLHNYRIICPTATLSHDGVITERSIHSGPWWAIRAGVYRGSKIATFVIAIMIAVHKALGTWSSKVSRLVALTPFSAELFIKAGMPKGKVLVKPNCTHLRAVEEGVSRAGFLYVGRLSPEKGIRTLLLALQDTCVSVRVAGTGSIVLPSRDGIVYLGELDRNGIDKEMRRAIAVVIPSICHEMFSLVAIEAFANATPVIASRLGTFDCLVEDGVNGILFQPGNAEDLREKLLWAHANPEKMREMGLAGYRKCESRYSPNRNYQQLISVYSEAILDTNARFRRGE